MLSTSVRISKFLSVGPQPGEEELKDLAKKGFRTIINLSKKGELNQKLSPEQEGEKAKELGLSYVHLPVSLASLKDEDAENFLQLFSDNPEPVYVHCRIGQRAVPLALIRYAMQKDIDWEKAVQKADKLGIPLDAPILVSFIKGYLSKRAEQENNAEEKTN